MEDSKAKGEINHTIQWLQNQIDELVRTTSQGYNDLVASVDARATAERETQDKRFGELRSLITGRSDELKSLITAGLSVLQGTATTTATRNRTDIMSLEVPKFDGTEPHSWVFKIEEYFNLHNTPEEHRIPIASFHMEGEASSWFRWLKTSNLLTTWADFLQKVKRRFGASQFEDHEGKLSTST